MIKRLGAAVLCSVLLTFPLAAATVSFLVIETGLPGLPGESGPGEYSSLWEDGLMGVFFDSGHIVSNGTVLRLEKPPAADLPDEARADFIEAKDGGAEYFVTALLDYRAVNGTYTPPEVSLRVFSTATGNMVFARQFPSGPGPDLREEYNRAQAAARAVITYLK
jgi:hypothetical protein